MSRPLEHIVPGRDWFSDVRLDGPLEPHLDRTWELGDMAAR